MSATILYDSQATLIAQPTFTEPAHLPCEWQGPSTDAEQLAEYSGRVCYLSYHNPAKRTTEEYLTNILAQGHGSVLEHANYTFLIEGISRSCSHELVRHRAGVAYSQVSQRYVDSSDVAFVIPPAFIGDTEAESLFESSCIQDLIYYNSFVSLQERRYAHIEDKVLRRKIARESSRSVLPNATETKIVMTGNVRAWRHICTMRTGEGADREIRRMALHILGLLQQAAPFFFGDFEVYTMTDGTTAARPRFVKV